MAFVATAIAGAATASAVAGIASIAALGAVTASVIGALAGAVVSAVVGGALISAPSSGSFGETSGTALANLKASNAPIPVVYGTRLVGGIIVYMDTGVQSGHGVFFLNIVLSEGEIEGYEKFYFNNEELKTSHEVNIDEFLGSETQEANPTLTNANSYYTDAHRLAGTAYLTVTFKAYASFPAGLPLINALVKGVKVFDPRISTVLFSDNPALCVRDYLTNSRYGRGIDTSLIDDTSFILAANYCDELVAYNGVDAIKRYTCNGLAETQSSSLTIINKLLSSCRGLLIFSGGLYKIIIDKPEMAGFTFSEDNIIGGWKIKLGSKNSQYNRMRANFFNSLRQYQPDIAYVDSPDLRAQDGGLLEIMTDLPFTTNYTIAKAIIAINLNQSRHSITCEFTSTIEGLRVEVGDVVYITHATPGWIDKKFRIMRVTLQNNDEVRIMANEYDDEVYNLDDIADEILAGEIELIGQTTCEPPTNLRVTETSAGGSGLAAGFTVVLVEWDVSPDQYLLGYEVSYGNLIDGVWDEQIDVGDSLSHSKQPSVTTTPFIFGVRVRAYNANNAKSEWVE